MEISGASIIVTGGTRGIGLEAARTLLDRGASVTITARTQASVDAGLDRLGGAGDRVAAVAADAATRAGADALARAARARFGRIDAIFTNAGSYVEASAEDTSEELWSAAIDGNLKSTMVSVQAVLDELRANHGTIVTMASFNGVTGVAANASAYGAAKAGVINLTRTLALELAPTVRVNCIAPGFVETEKLLERPDAEELIPALGAMTPVGRIGRRDEIAHALVFVLENEFVNGATINVDGGRCAGA